MPSPEHPIIIVFADAGAKARAENIAAVARIFCIEISQGKNQRPAGKTDTIFVQKCFWGEADFT
jgi:hypothetical protein